MHLTQWPRKDETDCSLECDHNLGSDRRSCHRSPRTLSGPGQVWRSEPKNTKHLHTNTPAAVKCNILGKAQRAREQGATLVLPTLQRPCFLSGWSEHTSDYTSTTCRYKMKSSCPVGNMEDRDEEQTSGMRLSCSFFFLIFDMWDTEEIRMILTLTNLLFVKWIQLILFRKIWNEINWGLGVI